MNTVAQVFGEAMRVPRYSRHVAEPRASIKLDGTKTLKKLEALRIVTVDAIRETVQSAKEKSYERGLRRNAATLNTEIHSHPVSVAALANDRAR
ncbi:MAG: hypothetical protein EP337_08310 [Rhodobacteraceae bacterium]|nr:MAG: hypothetical protein EP337_08310 [Paracoccaceae bacterium]